MLNLLAVIIGGLFIPAFILQWAWNIVVHPMFGLMSFTYWQAFGAMVVINIIGSAFRRK